MTDLATAAGQEALAAPRPSSRLRSTLRTIASEHLIWPIFLLLVAVGVMVPGFATSRNALNLLWGATPLGCMVVGLYFVMIAGRLDLSIESTFAFAPTIAIVTMTRWIPGLDPFIAIALTLLVGIAVGLVIGFVSVRLQVNAFLVTLATLLTLRGAVVWLIPEGVYNLPPTYTALGGVRIFGELPIAVIVMLVVFVAAWAVMRGTSFGRSLIGIGNNEEACRVAGINVTRVLLTAFALAGLFGAIGGLLQTGRLFSIDASMGDGDILTVFAAVTLGGTALNGGRGNVSGLLGAVLVIGTITNLMNLVGVESSIQQMVFGVILLGAILLSSLQDRLRTAGS